jgi:thiamine transport system ATP-binding protein
VLEGEPAARLLAAAGLPAAPAIAVRRSALAVDDRGPLAAEVLTVRATPGQVRLVCRTELGEVDALASLDLRLAPGDAVQLSVDRTRMAALHGDSSGGSSALN